MANVNAPYGARLIGHLYGSPHNARIRPYVVASGDSTALFVGDFVDMVQHGGTVNEYGVSLPTCTQSSSSSTKILGVVTGFMVAPASPYAGIYRPASTLRTALVCDDPYALFEIQANGTLAITAAMFGKNAKLSTSTGGSTIWGYSGMTLDSNTTSDTDDQLRIHGMSQRTNNEIGQYCQLIVHINDHFFNQKAGA